MRWSRTSSGVAARSVARGCLAARNATTATVKTSMTTWFSEVSFFHRLEQSGIAQVGKRVERNPGEQEERKEQEAAQMALKVGRDRKACSRGHRL